MASFTVVNNARKRQRHCFVPGCNTGYISKERKNFSMFSVPKNSELFRKWEQIIPKADKELDATCSVCELHFDPSFIEKDFKIIIEGKEVLLPRERPRLAKDAVPSIFPNLPKYFNLSVPKKRMETAFIDSQEPLKKELKKPDSVNDVNESSLLCEELTLEKMCQIVLPSKYWVLIKYEWSPDIICFAIWLSYSEKNLPDKRIVVQKVKNAFVCNVYLKEILILEKSVNNTDDVKLIVDEVNGYYICKGVGKTVDFLQAVIKEKLFSDDCTLRSRQCTGKVSAAGICCSSCKYQRKLLLNRCSYQRARIRCKKKKKFHISFKASEKLKKKYGSLLNKLKFLSDNKQNAKDYITENMSKLSHKQALEADSFLRSVCVPRGSTAPKIQRNYDDQESETGNENEHTQEYYDTNDDVIEATNDEEDVSGPKRRFLKKQFGVPLRKHFEIASVQTGIDELSEENKIDEEDEFDIFCRSLAVQLKKMPLDRAFLCQQKLQEVITQERVYQYRLMNSSSSFTVYLQRHMCTPTYLTPANTSPEPTP